MKLSKEEQSHLRGIANGPVFGRRSGDKEGGKGWANGGGRLIGNGEGTGGEFLPTLLSAGPGWGDSVAPTGLRVLLIGLPGLRPPWAIVGRPLRGLTHPAVLTPRTLRRGGLRTGGTRLKTSLGG